MNENIINIEKLNGIITSKSLIIEKSVRTVTEKLKVCDHVVLGHDYSSYELDNYEILTNRFSRAVETILKYFRTIELKEFGEKSDSVRIMLSKMEKLNFIHSVSFWLDMRLSRNKISHEYIEDGLLSLVQDIVTTYSIELVYTKDKILDYAKSIENE